MMVRMPAHARRCPIALLLLLLLAALATWALRSGAIEIPDRWNPWAPLHLDDTPNLLTRYKLERTSADRDACRTTLAQVDMRLSPLDDRETGPGCGFDNAFRIERTSVAVGTPFALSCRAALSLAMWERHALQQAAETHLGARVARIEHLGSYACRNRYGQAEGRRSLHATADALDVAGFVLEDGRRIRVLADWPPPASAERTSSVDANAHGEAVFLRAVRDGACAHFDAVLGPDYNAAHADHFHFDRGGGRVCR